MEEKRNIDQAPEIREEELDAALKDQAANAAALDDVSLENVAGGMGQKRDRVQPLECPPPATSGDLRRRKG